MNETDPSLPAIAPAAPSPSDPPWRRYPHVIPGTDPRWFTFPEAEGDEGWGANSWFLEGRLRGQRSGRDLALMVIFALNRIDLPFGRRLPVAFHVLSLFDLGAGTYGTTTEYDLPRPMRVRRTQLLRAARGLLDVSFETSEGRSRWSVRRDATGAPDPFRYALDLRGRDHLGERMAIALDVDVRKPPAPVGGDLLHGVKTCCAQLGTFSYFQTGLSLRGRVHWRGEEEEVAGDVGWIDRQYATRHFGAFTDRRNSRNRHEWRAIHLDNGWDMSVWQQFDAERGNRLVPYSGVTAQGPEGEVRTTSDFEIERLSFVRDPGAVRALYPLSRGPVWLGDRHHLAVRDWSLSLTAEPLVPAPAHGMPIEYWNGPVRLVGQMAGRPVSGFGFHERSRLWHRAEDLVEVLRETLRHLPATGPAGRTARLLASRAWDCDILLARGDRAGALAHLAEHVAPGLEELAPPGRDDARLVYADLVAALS